MYSFLMYSNEKKKKNPEKEKQKNKELFMKVLIVGKVLDSFMENDLHNGVFFLLSFSFISFLIWLHLGFKLVRSLVQPSCAPIVE